MVIRLIAIVVRALWFLIEYPYVLRHKIKPAKDWDRHSAKIWDAANALELVGIVFGFIAIGRMQGDLAAAGGLVLLLAGISIRFSAILTLGKYFTGTVLIKNDHRLIRSGLYRYLRHPAYSGALIAHLGLGLACSNWISLGLSVAPFSLAALYRIHVEEQALRGAFGAEYLDYSRTTIRLIPKVF